MKAITIALYELKRMLRQRSVLFILILSPLLLIFILGSALSDMFQPKDKPIEKVNVVYYQESSGPVTDGFQQFLTSDEVGDYLDASEVDTEAKVLEEVKAGKADMGVIIPEGFDAGVTSGDKASISFVLGRDKVKNMTGQMILQSFVDEANRMQAAVATLGPTAMPAMTGNANQSGQSSYVEQGKLIRNRDYSAMQYYSATMLIMFLLYSGMMASISLIKERENHTLSRLQSMPVSPIQILLSKLFGNGLFAGGQAAFLIGVAAIVYGVTWGGHPLLLILICLFTIIASMGLAFIISLVSKSTNVLSGLFASLIGIMTFISGGMAPHSGGFLAIAQKYTINYWASSSLVELMVGGSTSTVVHHVSVLGGIGVGLFLIALLMYRKVGFNE